VLCQLTDSPVSHDALELVAKPNDPGLLAPECAKWIDMGDVGSRNAGSSKDAACVGWSVAQWQFSSLCIGGKNM